MVSEHSVQGLMVTSDKANKDYIKWVDFDITYEALEDAMNVDIETYEQDLHVSWVDILAFLACKYGGDFSMYSHKDIDWFVETLNEGSSVEDITSNMKSYPYYYKAYCAVIGNFLGLDKDGNYGLTAYSPVAEGYWYTDSDDFGNGRSYGFARKHLGHDMFCSVGTPVAAVEGGKVEALGWNQYGGWRIGIRSNDGFSLLLLCPPSQRFSIHKRSQRRRHRQSRSDYRLFRPERIQRQRKRQQYQCPSPAFRYAAGLRRITKKNATQKYGSTPMP